MQTIKRSEASSSVAENEPSEPTAPNAEAGKQASSKKITGLHKITPCTLKSLKTSFDQTSGHCVEFGSLWKAGRLARGSVNCLRIFREVTLFLPRASVAFGNDLAEHFLNVLEKIADRFDGKHGIEGEEAKPKAKWLAIVFMFCVFVYCFNGLKNFSSGQINITSSSTKEDKDDKVEKAVETAIADNSEDVADNNVGDEPAKHQGGASNIVDLQAGPKKASLSEKKLKKAVKDFVKEVFDSK